MKNALAVFLFVFLVFGLCGCFDYREINDTAMVSGIAIDEAVNGGKYTVSVEIIQSTGSEGSSPKGKILSESGETVETCLKKLVNAATKELHFSHCKLILFSRQIASQGILDLVDYFLRDSEYRPDILLAVVDGTNAKEMLGVGEKEGRICAFAFADVIQNSFTETGSVPPTKLYQFSMDGDHTLLPSFRKIDDTFSVDSVCGFQKGRLTHLIPLREAQSIMLTSNEYKSGEVLLFDDEGTAYSCKITDVKTTKKVVEGNTLSVFATVECKVLITSLPKNLKIATQTDLESAQNKIQELLQKKLEDDWQKAVAEGYHMYYGLSLYVYRHKPKQYAEWKDDWAPVIPFVQKCKIHLENQSISDERLE